MYVLWPASPPVAHTPVYLQRPEDGAMHSVCQAALHSTRPSPFKTSERSITEISPGSALLQWMPPRHGISCISFVFVVRVHQQQTRKMTGDRGRQPHRGTVRTTGPVTLLKKSVYKLDFCVAWCSLQNQLRKEDAKRRRRPQKFLTIKPRRKVQNLSTSKP